MSMFQSLFGGVLAIAALYYLLRLFGVGNYWRGVLAGLVPVIGYLALNAGHWPGGDVISMHMAVYLATATVLTLIGARRRGESKKLHWGPKLIILFFLALFAIDAALLMISGKGVPPEVAKWLLPPGKHPAQGTHTAFSGVVSHGEEAAKTIGQHMASVERQERLGWRVEISGLERLVSGREVTIGLTARDAGGAPLREGVATLELLRPGLAQAEQVSRLAETDPGVYRTQLTPAQPGERVAVIRLERAGARYEQQARVMVLAR